MTDTQYQQDLADLSATAGIATVLADLAQPRDVIALSGPLGAGKSALARAFIRRRLRDASLEVPSPTFTLVQVYGDPPDAVWHFDLYRIEDPEECWELGFEEALVDGICLIEWPDRLGDLLPGDRLDVRLAVLPDDARQVELTGHGAWERRLRDWTARSHGGIG